MKVGVEVTRVHRVVKYRQDYIFKNYIEKNTIMRARANNKFEKDYYKLKNNS